MEFSFSSLLAIYHWFEIYFRKFKWITEKYF